jgi:sarcosine oxidase
MQRTYDTIVIGVGGMGSAAVLAQAKRGERVLGIEQFQIPHEFGSSAGQTRIFRYAYFEHPSYVPLMRRAFVLWQELQRETDDTLFQLTGGLTLGPADGAIVAGARASVRTHTLTHEDLTGTEINRRFPGWRVPATFAGVVEPDAGFLFADRCIVAHVAAARRRGAEILTDTAVTNWSAASDSVSVSTSRGTFSAARIIFTAGAWTGALLPELAARSQPERRVVGWFRANPVEHFAPDRFPVFILEAEDGEPFYGFPDVAGTGFKIGSHVHAREPTAPSTIRRTIDAADEVIMRRAIRRYLPGADGAMADVKTCMYQMTRDEHFVIDHLPGHTNVVVATGFSGHGYKFCSAIGEAVGDLAVEGRARADLSLFSLARFAT